MKGKIWLPVAAALTATTAVLGAQTATPPYHLKQEVELKGRVASVQTIPDWMGKDGVNLTLHGPESSVVATHVDVATASFLRTFDFPLAVGDNVTLLGSWSTTADGTQVFLVRELTNKKVSINVRDPQGAPLW